MANRKFRSDIHISGNLNVTGPISEQGQLLIEKYALSGTSGGGTYDTVGSGLYENGSEIGVDFTQVAQSGNYLTLTQANNLYAASGNYLDQSTANGLYEISGTVDNHEAASDPHPQYLTQTEADVLYQASGTGSGTGTFDTAGSGLYANGSEIGFDTIWGDQRYALSGAGGGSAVTEVHNVEYLIDSQRLTSAGSFSFSGNWNDYDYLKIIGMFRTTDAALDDEVEIIFNNDTTLSNYHRTQHQADEDAHSINETSAPRIMRCTGSSTNRFVMAEIFLPNPTYPYLTEAMRRYGRCWAYGAIYSSKIIQTHTTFHWDSSAIISGIVLQGDAGALTSGCWAKLYGIKETEVMVDGADGSGGAGATSFSGLNDVQSTGWSSGLSARFDGSEWVPVNLDALYMPSGAAQTGGGTYDSIGSGLYENGSEIGFDTTWGDARYQASGNYLTKTQGDSLYAPSGSTSVYTSIGSGLYEVGSELGVDFTQVAQSGNYLTKTQADGLYAPSGNYLTQTEADALYATSGDYLTQAEADTLYQASGVFPSHNHSGLYEVSGTVANHVAALDPHPQYLTQAEGDVLYAPSGDYLTEAEGNVLYAASGITPGIPYGPTLNNGQRFLEQTNENYDHTFEINAQTWDHHGHANIYNLKDVNPGTNDWRVAYGIYNSVSNALSGNENRNKTWIKGIANYVSGPWDTNAPVQYLDLIGLESVIAAGSSIRASKAAAILAEIRLWHSGIYTEAYPIQIASPQYISGRQDSHAQIGTYAGLHIQDQTNHEGTIGSIDSILIDAQTTKGAATSGNFRMAGGGWDSGHIQLQNVHLWQYNGSLYAKSGIPTAADDGIQLSGLLSSVGSGLYKRLDEVGLDVEWTDERYALKGSVNKYQSITIDHTKVSGNLTDFVLFVDLNDLDSTIGRNFWHTVNDDYSDVWVTKDDSVTWLPFEIVDFDKNTKTGQMWVRYTGILSSGQDTTIYIWYNGDPSASPMSVSGTYGAQNVWTDYFSVWHYDNKISGVLYDSTENNISGVFTGGTVAQSPVGDAHYINNSVSDRIDLVPENNQYPSGSIAFSTWINISGENATNEEVIFNLNWSYSGSPDNNGGFYVSYITNDGSNKYLTMDYVISTGSHSLVNTSNTGSLFNIGDWYHVICARDNQSGSLKIFVNGVERGSATGNTAAIDYDYDTGYDNDSVNLGAKDAENYPGPHWPIYGSLAETRLAPRFIDGNWAATEYNNQSNTLNFYSISEELEAGATAFTSAGTGLIASGRQVSFDLSWGDSRYQASGVGVGNFELSGTVDNHEAASDPHPQYLTESEANLLYEASGTADTKISAHEATANPHPVYLTQAEGDVLYQPSGVLPAEAFDTAGSGLYSTGSTVGLDVNWTDARYAAKGDVDKFQTITIDHTKISGTVEDLVLYVDLADLGAVAGNTVFDTAYDDGRDIWVTKSDGSTRLPREIINFNKTAKTGELWIRYPGMISNSVDTEIYVWYNGDSDPVSISGTYGEQNVWADYFAAYHFGNEEDRGAGISTTLYDSSANERDGSYSSPVLIAAPVGSGYYVANTSARNIDLPNEAGQYPAKDISFFSWINISGEEGSNEESIFNLNWSYSSSTGRNGGLYFRYVTDDGANKYLNVDFATSDTESSHQGVSTSNAGSLLTIGQWNLVGFTRDAATGNVTIWVNGSGIASSTLSTAAINYDFSTSYDDDSVNLCAKDAENYPGPHWPLWGSMAEPRLISGVFNAARIRAEYLNQSNPSTFYSVSVESEASALGFTSVGTGLTASGTEVSFDVSWGDGRYALSGDYLTQTEGDALYQASGTVPSHTHATLYEASGTVDNHEAATDPHPQYLTQTEADSLYAASGTGGGGGATTYPGLTDVQDTGWSSGLSSRFDGTNWVPVDLDNIYALSGATGSGGGFNSVGSGLYSAGLLVGFDSAWGDARYALSGSGGTGSSGDVSTTKQTQKVKIPLETKIISSTISGVAFTGDWSEYESLEFQGLARSNKAWNHESLFIYFNNDTTDSNYDHGRQWDGGYGNDNTPRFIEIVAASSPSNSYSYFTATIDYPTSQSHAHKTIYGFSRGRDQSDGCVISDASVTWSNNDAITKVYFVPGYGGNLISGTQVTLYGIKEVDMVTDVTGGGSSGGGDLSTTTTTVQIKEFIGEKILTSDSPSGILLNYDWSEYDELIIEGQLRNDESSGAWYGWIYFNGDNTASNYYYQRWSADGNNRDTDSRIFMSPSDGGHNAANQWHFDCHITNLNNTNNWTNVEAHSFGVNEFYTPDRIWDIFGAAHWRNTAKVTSIYLDVYNTNYVSGSRLKVYGIKNQEIVTAVTGGGGTGATSFSGLNDVNTSGWTSGLSSRFDGTTWQPIDLDKVYSLSGSIGGNFVSKTGDTMTGNLIINASGTIAGTLDIYGPNNNIQIGSGINPSADRSDSVIIAQDLLQNTTNSIDITDSIIIGNHIASVNNLNFYIPDESVVIGNYAMHYSGMRQSVALGYRAGERRRGSRNVLLGHTAGGSVYTIYNSEVNDAIAIGYNANLAGTGSVYIGARTGEFPNSSTNVIEYAVAIGHYAGYQQTGGQNSVYIGKEAGRQSNNGNSVGIGSEAADQLTGSSNSVAIGFQASHQSSDMPYSVAIGYQAGYFVTDAENMIAIGKSAGSVIGPQTNLIAIGAEAGYNGFWTHSILLGTSAGSDYDAGLFTSGYGALVVKQLDHNLISGSFVHKIVTINDTINALNIQQSGIDIRNLYQASGTYPSHNHDSRYVRNNCGIGGDELCEDLKFGAYSLIMGGGIGQNTYEISVTSGQFDITNTGGANVPILNFNDLIYGNSTEQWVWVPELRTSGSVQVADDPDAPTADKAGALRYRVSGNNSYCDMCMQVSGSTYAWVNIVQNNW